MSVRTELSPNQGTMKVLFVGNLDITLAYEVCRACSLVSSSVRSCVLDLRRVNRVFDSGVALLLMLCQALCANGVKISILGNSPSMLDRYAA